MILPLYLIALILTLKLIQESLFQSGIMAQWERNNLYQEWHKLRAKDIMRADDAYLRGLEEGKKSNERV